MSRSNSLAEVPFSVLGYKSLALTILVMATLTPATGRAQEPVESPAPIGRTQIPDLPPDPDPSATPEPLVLSPDAQSNSGGSSQEPGSTEGSASTTSSQTAAPEFVRELTRDEAERLLLEMGKKAAAAGYSPDYTGDGCSVRAWWYEEAALNFVTDDGARLHPDIVQRYHVTAGKEAPWYNPLARSSGLTNGWKFHTAVAIPVRDDKGKTLMVFDPATDAEEPQPAREFLKDMLPSTGGRASRDDHSGAQTGQNDFATFSIEPSSHADMANAMPRSQRVRPGMWDDEARRQKNEQAFANSQRAVDKVYEEWEAEGNDRYQWKSRDTGRFDD